MTAENDRHEEHFDVSPGSELSVSNVSGQTKVRAADVSQILVTYTRRGGSKFNESAQIEVTKSGNRVSVQTRPRGTGILNFSRSTGVDYDITVPRDCSVTLQSVSADANLSGTRGTTGVRTVSGDVTISDVAGDVSITTVSGDVSGTNLSGTLIGRSTSGDMTVLSSRFRRFSLNSVSGDFKIETPLSAEEQCNAKTVSGDLELLIPASSGATVQLKSVSGSVTCELPAEIIKAGRRHWQGRINGGGGNVEMNSVSGDLTVRRSSNNTTDIPSASGRASDHAGHTTPLDHEFEGAGVNTPTDDTPGVTQDLDAPAIEDTLAALERGEISVEDAMAKIG